MCSWAGGGDGVAGLKGKLKMKGGGGGQAFAEGAAGVEEAGFDGAERGGGDFGDGFERKVLDEVEQEDGALGRGEFVDESEEGGGLFGAEEAVAGIGREVVGRGGEGVAVERLLAAGAAPVLDDLLVGDAEEPGAEAGVVAEGGEVAVGGDEGILHEIEGGGLVVKEFLGVGEERELVAVEEGAPAGGPSGARGGHGGSEVAGGRRGGAGHRGVREVQEVEWTRALKVQSDGAIS